MLPPGCSFSRINQHAGAEGDRAVVMSISAGRAWGLSRFRCPGKHGQGAATPIPQATSRRRHSVMF